LGSQDNIQLWVSMAPFYGWEPAVQGLTDDEAAVRLLSDVLLPVQLAALVSGREAQPPKVPSRAERRREQRQAAKRTSQTKSRGGSSEHSNPTQLRTSTGPTTSPPPAQAQGLCERLCQALCQNGSAQQYLRDLLALEHHHPITVSGPGKASRCGLLGSCAMSVSGIPSTMHASHASSTSTCVFWEAAGNVLIAGTGGWHLHLLIYNRICPESRTPCHPGPCIRGPCGSPILVHCRK
jgi:hypothetical protein